MNKSNQEKLNQKKIKREIQQYNSKGKTRKSEPDSQHPLSINVLKTSFHI